MSTAVIDLTGIDPSQEADPVKGLFLSLATTQRWVYEGCPKLDHDEDVEMIAANVVKTHLELLRRDDLRNLVEHTKAAGHATDDQGAVAYLIRTHLLPKE